MKVLCVTSECYPFAKSGGLADVLYALPKAMVKEGVDARVIMPLYGSIDSKYRDAMEDVTIFDVQVGWRRQYCGIKKLYMDGVTFYFVDNEYYFNRSELYGHYDDGERFAYFCRAVLESIPRLGFQPDVLHCNDWHTGAIGPLLKEHYMDNPRCNNLKLVFTIHNLQYQGIFPKEVLSDLLSLPDTYMAEDKMEFYGNVNFMKGGINFADLITTVSPTYAMEIKYSFFGERLEGLLKSKEQHLRGILNGIDNDIFNPETDDDIYQKYGIKTRDKKVINKIKLQEELGLPVNPDVPMVGLISRLVRQKGIDLISHVIKEILANDLQLVVLGNGEERYESLFEYYGWACPDKVSANITFNHALAQKIYAASDIFMMPSLFEPCGIGQMIALRYGALPIVRETGGLKDTVTPYNEYTQRGNGFTFSNYNAHEMLFTLEKALSVYKEKDKWDQLVKNAMQAENGWEKSAQAYKEIYDKLINS